MRIIKYILKISMNLIVRIRNNKKNSYIKIIFRKKSRIWNKSNKKNLIKKHWIKKLS